MENNENSLKLGKFVAEVMESLDNEMSDAKLGDVLIICELQRSDDDGNFTTTRYVCTDPRQHIHMGLLRQATIASESP